MQNKILIVEDEAITAMDIKRMIESLGFKVVGTASRGKEAIQKAEELKPDLILMDIVLKGHMDGVEASNEIQKSLDIPIIYMTAFSDEETFKRAKLTKPYGFITKPVSYDGLLVSIETAIYKHELDNKLAESEEKYRLISENMGDVVWILDLNKGLFNYVSPSVYNLRGYTPEEVLSQSMEDVLTPDSYQIVLQGLPSRVESFKKGNKSAKVQTHQIDQTCKNGSIVSTEVVTTLLTNEKGEITEILGVSRDISKRIKAEKALKESKEKLRKARDNLELKVQERTLELENAYAEISDLYNNAPCGYHSLDKNGFFVKINDTELKWLGYSREEIIGKKKFTDLITDESIKTFKKNFPGFKRRGYVYDLEFDMIRKDKSSLSVIVNATAIYDNDEYSMSRSTLFDITERKKAELDLEISLKNLKESENQFRTLAENLPDLIIRVDKNLNCTYMNSNITQFTGKDHDFFIGKSLNECGIPEDFTYLWEKAYQEAFNTGKTQYNKLQIPTVNGMMEFDTRTVPEFNDNGDIKSAITVIRNITKRE